MVITIKSWKPLCEVTIEENGTKIQTDLADVKGKVSGADINTFLETAIALAKHNGINEHDFFRLAMAERFETKEVKRWTLED